MEIAVQVLITQVAQNTLSHHIARNKGNDQKTHIAAKTYHNKKEIYEHATHDI
jgi:hypothetical protein